MDIDFLNPTAEDQMELMRPANISPNVDFYNTHQHQGCNDYHNIASVPFQNYYPDPDSPHPCPPSSISFSGEAINPAPSDQQRSSMAAMREMIFRMAAMQPVHIDPESVKPPRRRNVRVSTDPQSVAARHRRERISERIRILQRLVPGGTKMDTASMLDEAVHYVKFLKNQVRSLERAGLNRPTAGFHHPSPHRAADA